jgi:hypothetical protein
MKVFEGTRLAEIDAQNELYRPISVWCRSLYSARPDDDVTAWFYQAFDKVVRHPDFNVDDLRAVRFANWFELCRGAGSRRAD